MNEVSNKRYNCEVNFSTYDFESFPNQLKDYITVMK